MMTRIFTAVALVFLVALPGVASAQSVAWTIGDKAITHASSGLSAQRKIGPFAYKGVTTFSKPQEGLDTAAQWETADGKSAITLYAYLPTLGDEGLAFIATDRVIRSRFGTATKLANDMLVSVGGVPAGARVVDYDGAVGTGGFSGPLWTAFSVLRAGDWLIKIRVSGPVAQKSVLKSALTQLLGALKFSPANLPQTIHKIAVSPCTTEGQFPAAKRVTLSPEEIVKDVQLISGLDFGATDKAGKRAYIKRMPDAFCYDESATPPGQSYAVLYPLKGRVRGTITETAMIIIFGDSGTLLEVSQTDRSQPRYVMILHSVGEANFMSYVDGPLNSAQIASIVSGKDDGMAKFIAGYDVKANGEVAGYVIGLKK
jgi:hypothetical protein